MRVMKLALAAFCAEEITALSFLKKELMRAGTPACKTFKVNGNDMEVKDEDSCKAACLALNGGKQKDNFTTSMDTLNGAKTCMCYNADTPGDATALCTDPAGTGTGGEGGAGTGGEGAGETATPACKDLSLASDDNCKTHCGEKPASFHTTTTDNVTTLDYCECDGTLVCGKKSEGSSGSS